MTPIGALRGTRDILPGESAALRWLLETHRRVVESHGYRYIETPVMEPTELFERGVGSGTDVVEKEMFTFIDRGGRSVTLRPEGTAGVVRAVLSHHLDQEVRPLRVHYAGPFFRNERPQAGVQRQFTQVGVECIGERGPELDVEVIEMGWRFYETLSLHGVRLQVNSLGDGDDRLRYRDALVAYYEPLREQLCDDCRRRLRTNPLRLLDCKEDRRFVDGAPYIWDHLSDTSRTYFEAVQRGLEDAGVPATVNPRLVRGLDYYADTAFEFWHEALHGSQNALGGGGRYDGLAEVLGFPPAPGIGYALGVERILLVSRDLGVQPADGVIADVLVLSVGDEAAGAAASAARALRGGGLRVVADLSDRRLDRKLRNADRLQARAGVIVGESEVAAGTAVVRDLQQRSQETVPTQHLLDAVRRLLDPAS
jgi:histidyl-tRNA synthetase